MTAHSALADERAALAGVAPDVVRAFGRHHQASLGDGEIDRLTKELMALAISVVTGCEGCCEHHLAASRAAGATDAQLAETLGVAVLMGGGPAYTQAGRVAVMMRAEAGSGAGTHEVTQEQG